MAAVSIAPELRRMLLACRPALIGVALGSALVNVLMLTAPLFMLQVYDRVLPSRSLGTLVGLALMALTAFALQALADLLRARLLTRVGQQVDEALGARCFDAALELNRGGSADPERPDPLRDMDVVRSFATGSGFSALFDLPWVPLYVALCFLFHPTMGVAVLAGALVLCALTMVADRVTRRSTAALVGLAAVRRASGERAARNGELLRALGLRQRMAALWSRDSRAYLDGSTAASDLVLGFANVSRLMRTVLQSGVLALGAYLVINGEATAGVMLAATVVSTRALAPVDAIIANWKGMSMAREAFRRLNDCLKAAPAQAARTPLPAPCRRLTVTNVSLAAPGSDTVVLHDASFTLERGSALGIIGPSGSGKSSLARALVGAWSPVRGVIRLDGATLDQWDSDALGRSLGYLPQTVEVFRGTVAQNIARFDPQPEPDRLTAAARAAGVHELVLRLPQGYDTDLGEDGGLLSGGQRQRIGLARALYGEPFLVVLDEPNSNLDAEGEAALAVAIQGVRNRGGIAVVVAHRPSALAAVDRILVLNEGRVQSFGAREDVIAQVSGPSRPTPVQTESAPPGEPRQRAARKAAAR